MFVEILKEIKPSDKLPQTTSLSVDVPASNPKFRTIEIVHHWFQLTFISKSCDLLFVMRVTIGRQKWDIPAAIVSC